MTPTEYRRNVIQVAGKMITAAMGQLSDQEFSDRIECLRNELYNGAVDAEPVLTPRVVKPREDGSVDHAFWTHDPFVDVLDYFNWITVDRSGVVYAHEGKPDKWYDDECYEWVSTRAIAKLGTNSRIKADPSIKYTGNWDRSMTHRSDWEANPDLSSIVAELERLKTFDRYNKQGES